MGTYKQIDCFSGNMCFWKITGIWPGEVVFKYYKYYSVTFIVTVYYFYFCLPTINFYFLPKAMDVIIEETLFYFSEVNVMTKIVTFIVMRDKINFILEILESDSFQPRDKKGKNIVVEVKRYIVLYWKVVAVFSVISNATHVLSPFIVHLLYSVKLELPLCSYAFLPNDFKEKFIYPIYFYQCIGMHFHMWINVNIDTFLLGLMLLVIAQLELLDNKLRSVTNVFIEKDERKSHVKRENRDKAIKNLKHAIKHLDAVIKFCNILQDVFSISLLIQFGVASCLLCVCLFRFTLPAPMPYLIFLTTYMFIMTIQILVPCWFGNQIMNKSYSLSRSIYECNWIHQNKQFKSTMRLFIERSSKPIILTGGKMFPVTLSSFTSIINSAYSFFTLLRHVKYIDTEVKN